MTVYNGMPFIRQAVESVLVQSFADFRFVIVNDGSTDGTADYLASLTDSRIIVVNQANQGTAAAANHGLEIIDTEYVARMDADDFALPHRLEKQWQFMRANSEVGIVGAQVAPAGEKSVGKSLRLPVSHEEILRAMLAGRHGLAHSVIMIRTRILKELGGYWSLPLIDDWDMMLRVGEVAKLANLDEVLLHYRVHAGSLNGQNMKRMHRHIGYAIARAKARTGGSELPTFADYELMLNQRPIWTKAIECVHIHAMANYRLAIAELYSGREWKGLARLGWSACCSPSRTFHRIGRVFRSRSRQDESVPETNPISHQSAQPTESTIGS